MTILQQLSSHGQLLHHLVADCGARRPDLRDLGLSDHAARRLLRETTVAAPGPSQVVVVPPVGLPPVVALVPVNSIARRFLCFDVYLRDAGLRGQLRLRATHIGWSDNGRIDVVRPITNRWLIGSAAALPRVGLSTEAGLLAEPDVHRNWPGPATLVELGSPQLIGLNLGFAPNPTGGAPAIPGVRHVLLSDLQAAAQAGTVLTGVRSL